MSEKMIFCLGDGRWESKGEGYQKNLRVFNKDVSEERYQEVRKLLNDNEVKISLTHWVEAEDMTKEDKENYSNWKSLDGCLKVFGYQEAWETFWSEATQTQKNSILDLPEFDKDIFKEITGIEVDKTPSLKGKTVKVELDGVTYEAVIK